MNLLPATVLLFALAVLPAPLSATACVDKLPIFGDAQPSTKPSPYTITVTPTTVNAGGTVRVRISGSENFHSVYLQAGNGEQPVGEFLAPSGQGCRAGVFGCPNGQKNAFSYNSRRGTKEAEVEWKAPQINAQVAFRATIVKSFTEFWVGVESAPITVRTATRN
ncbi:putative defense protein [Schistocerca gregaria]|uniref:putative defense protein n=1 Tax=Schistocerca gregaria TaxID=7010 RepID=UPI00211E9FBC|nr:putative defense protein [Schistocerca gregaria]